MSGFHDGPASALFEPLRLKGNVTFPGLKRARLSKHAREHVDHALRGRCTCWGIPFEIRKPVLLTDKPVFVSLKRVKARWLVFLHTADVVEPEWNKHGFISPTRGRGRLGEHAANYVVCFEDGSEKTLPIRRRFQIGMVARGWGENCFEAVNYQKPHPVRPLSEQWTQGGWGWTQTRATQRDIRPWNNWLWAWQNPHPAKAITGIRLEPISGTILLSAISAGRVSSQPLRWEMRKKALLRLPRGERFAPELDEKGLLSQIQLDLGEVISAVLRPVYPNETWTRSYNNQLPQLAEREVLVEYTAHPEARFHVLGGTVPVAQLDSGKKAGPLTPVAPSSQRVTLRVIEKGSKRPVPVKLHVHGEAGEYLAPVDRHRLPNPHWFEDYSCDFLHGGAHWATYIPGETVIDLPLGKVYLEVSKGFEIKPIRKVLRVTPGTRQITILVEKVLPWRERGWVTADTHVHFLSPHTARLEGAAEGVNVVNLLASQWGELMTNVGDFDGKSALGSREAGDDGEYLVRVGTENRQHVLGHISLLGYRGNIIAPMTTGGPDESALGDPVGILLTEWARQCHKQGGLVVLPHFPNPRCENAAAIIDGSIDAVEMTSWGNLYGGIDPYSLSDWYRYLNCGYFLPAVAGTDKMSATTPVGAVRTYARIPEDQPFTYDSWMAAVRAGHTFVTYGPLLEFAADGRAPGAWIRMTRTGGTMDVTWTLASVTVPMTRAELVVNGEIRESRTVGKWADSGHFSARIDRSSWIALLVRGKYRDRPEMIAAHSSPVMVEVEGTPFYSAADALTILEQIEGALAYLDTLATRAQTREFKRMRLVLTAAHRTLHNRMHLLGHFHEHTPVMDHH